MIFWGKFSASKTFDGVQRCRRESYWKVEKAEQAMDRRHIVRKNKGDERGKTENTGCEIGMTKTAMERGV